LGIQFRRSLEPYCIPSSELTKRLNISAYPDLDFASSHLATTDACTNSTSLDSPDLHVDPLDLAVWVWMSVLRICPNNVWSERQGKPLPFFTKSASSYAVIGARTLVLSDFRPKKAYCGCFCCSRAQVCIRFWNKRANFCDTTGIIAAFDMMQLRLLCKDM
jgi:hypothetical protein